MIRPAKKGKKAKKHLSCRLKESGIFSKLISLCQENELEMFQAFGYLGHKFYLNKADGNFDMKRGQMFNQILNNTNPVQNILPVDLALYLMVSMEILEKSTYIWLRHCQIM